MTSVLISLSRIITYSGVATTRLGNVQEDVDVQSVENILATSVMQQENIYLISSATVGSIVAMS